MKPPQDRASSCCNNGISPSSRFAPPHRVPEWFGFELNESESAIGPKRRGGKAGGGSGRELSIHYLFFRRGAGRSKTFMEGLPTIRE
jgi:hypothetical protein